MKEFLVSALRIILLKTVNVEIMKEGVISVDHWIELTPSLPNPLNIRGLWGPPRKWLIFNGLHMQKIINKNP